MIAIRRTVGVLLTLLGFGAGAWLAAAGFADVQRLRDVEQLPIVARLGAVLPGDAALRGIARPAGLVAGSPRTGSPSLYYRFLHEVRTGDGNGQWETRVDRAEAVDFVLVDASGRIRVAAQRDFLRIAFEAPERFHRTEGRNRYTEWRIEPGDEVVLVGRARMTPSGMELGFRDAEGPPPRVSAIAEDGARSGGAGAPLFRLSTGLALLSLGVFGVALAIGLHRVGRFLALATVVLALAVALVGLEMLRADLARGIEAQQLREAAARARFGREFGRAGLPFTSIRALDRLDGPALAVLPRETRANLQAIREDLERARLRLEGQYEALPVRWLAALAGLSLPEGGSWLPASEQAAVAERETALPPMGAAASRVTAFGVGGLLLAGLLSWVGLRRTRAKRRDEALPARRTTAVTAGLVELEGTVEAAEGLLTSPLEGRACVWFDYRVEERGSTKDEGGGRWRTVERRTEAVSFLCRDEDGAIAVEPDGAEVRSRRRSSRTEDGRRVTECRIEVEDPCHVRGLATVRGDDMDRLGLRASEAAPLRLANLPAGEVRRREGVAGLGLLAVAATLVTLACLLLAAGDGISPGDFLLAAVGAPLWLAVVMVVVRLDELRDLRAQAQRNWSTVQVSLRRRRNLVRPLNALVSRYLADEEALQQRLAALLAALRRATDSPAAAAHYLAAEQALAQELRTAIGRHPKLAGAKAVTQLTRALTRLENEIGLLRTGHDDAVARYALRARSFPGPLLARACRFEPLQPLGPGRASPAAG